MSLFERRSRGSRTVCGLDLPLVAVLSDTVETYLDQVNGFLQHALYVKQVSDLPGFACVHMLLGSCSEPLARM